MRGETGLVAFAQDPTAFLEAPMVVVPCRSMYHYRLFLQ